MKLLAFDASTYACTVALQIGSEIQSFHEIAPMQQTRLLLPKIQEMLQYANVKLADLDAIAFGCGPGSFTGIRLAASVAQGLAFAANLPVIPISSLAAMAQAAFMQHDWQALLVAQDARMNEIYWAAYRANSTKRVELIGEEHICAPENINKPNDNQWYGIGDAWEKYGVRMGLTPSIIDSKQVPTGEAILALARVKFERQEWVEASKALPVYLR